VKSFVVTIEELKSKKGTTSCSEVTFNTSSSITEDCAENEKQSPHCLNSASDGLLIIIIIIYFANTSQKQAFELHIQQNRHTFIHTRYSPQLTEHSSGFKTAASV